MKRFFIFISALSLLAGCDEFPVDNPDGSFSVQFPVPTEQITKVALNETEQGYVNAGNQMAFRFLGDMFDGSNLVISPLSLQYALAMTANGASGETLQEITDFLGYGSEGIDALNAYSKKMLEQLPAVDLDVTLKLTDAMLVNDVFTLYPDFKKAIEENYYAAVENMAFTSPGTIASRVNRWASRNTDGFIDNVLDASDISPNAAAFLLNALYFKAKWSGSEYDPMFEELATKKDRFTRSDGSDIMVKYMNNMRYHRYAEMDGYRVLSLPYAGGKFRMYILLPDGNDLKGLVDKLGSTAWSDILASFKSDAEVYVKLPKFDIENKFNLSESLARLGVKKAFKRGQAEFDKMFTASEEGWYFWIENVIQKAKISVAEWGTEAAAVTVVQMAGEMEPGPPQEEPKRVYFYADHPFVFIIGEETSGTILFEGAYTGK